MHAGTASLIVLCSLHAAICFGLAAAIFLPIIEEAAAVPLALSIAAFGVARRTSRNYHKRRADRASGTGSPAER